MTPNFFIFYPLRCCKIFSITYCGFVKYSIWPKIDSLKILRSSLTYLLSYLLTYLPTYLLTYSRVQSPSWELNWFAASQEIPRISRNPKVHYRTHKRPPPVSILGQPNPVHNISRENPPCLHYRLLMFPNKKKVYRN